jgi:hypothetical protein
MRLRAEKNTMHTLLTAQELGQKKPVSFGKENAQQERA